MTLHWIRRTTALAALTALCLLPVGTTPDADAGMHLGRPSVHSCDDLFAWRSCSDAWERWLGKSKSNNGKAKHGYMVSRGGNKASSNPTTVPVVDDDLKFSVFWTHEQIQTRMANRVSRGAGTTVAVLDGGFNLYHPAIRDNLMGSGYDAVDGDYDAHDTGNWFDDDYDGLVDSAAGHGTFVAGLILQVAPEATILPIRVRDDEGWGTNKELEDGLMRAFMMGADVINISGQTTTGRSRHITNMVEYFSRAGIVVVNSAGNDGYEWISQVGDEGTALVVGAVNQDDQIAEFSNRPAAPGRMFVYAPGVDLYGPLGIHGDWDNYGYWSGTSFSCALVSGGAALLKSAKPWWPASEVIHVLMTEADPVRDAWGRPTGYSRINLAKAVSR